MRLAIASAVAFCCLAGNHVSGQAVFVRTLDSKAKVRVGTVIKETPDTLEIRDLADGSELSLVKSELKKIEKGDDAAISAIGLPAVAAVRVAEIESRVNATGKIARVTQNVIYITLGEKSGIAVKQKLNVFRTTGEIRDPDTNKLLGKERSKIGTLEVTEVNKELSKAKSLSELEVTLQAGDEVEEARPKMQIAVFPLRAESGRQIDSGTTLAEEMTTQLIRNNVAVLERSLIEKVLAEQIVQNTVLFEPEQTQRLGSLLGASAVLTGKIVPNDKDDTAFVRLIDVSSGKILFAARSSVKRSKGGSGGSGDSGGSPSKSSGGSKSSDSSSSTAKSQPDDQGGKWIELGGRQKFPALFQPTKEITSQKNGLTCNGRNYVMTRKGDYLTRDFKFELVFSFRDDTNLTAKDIMFVGIGEADRGGSEPQNSVYLRVHPPNVDGGSIGLAKQPARSFTGLGKVIGPGPHRVIIEKKEDVVTYMIDIDNDGESDGDSEQTLPDIKEVGPFLHKKNTFLFFGGGGIFQRVRISTPD